MEKHVLSQASVFAFSGFLVSGDGDASGNLALKDQVLALQWVVENMAMFSGNPERVTLGGLMAGAAYVGMHMVSPMSKGNSLCFTA